ncbi:HEPN domain-containing protein [Vreelandella venusta]|uniref:HEPN domain-containing protein n=1 Tax=Vreelandella venusta TaxID=44935 RepID=A0AAP9ZG85_9GAMM|nr:HEPN domain-containing protein [Halomonas venusta]QRL05129.1 HEPN domain-containing protein [Halomonas venusta]GEK50895.1 hypothetical protein HVE01_16160 [Halomonas venusta]
MPDRLIEIADHIESAHLASTDIEQHRIRSAINRAYYAAFLTARGVCEEKGFEGSGSSHEKIVDALIRQPGLVPLGNKLKDIKTLRHAADYKWGRNMSHRDMKKVIRHSRELISSLQAI